MKRILYFIRLYRESMEEAKTDIFGNSLELAVHYKVEIVKYLFLLTINIIEVSTVVILVLSNSLVRRNGSITSNCSSLGNYMYNLEIDLVDPSELSLSSIAKIGFLFSLTLVICLIKYLDVTYHNINGKPFRFIKPFLFFSAFISVVLILPGSVPQLFILEKLYEPIIQFSYFCLWIKQTRIFYRTLKWRSLEFQVRGRSTQWLGDQLKAIVSSHSL